MNCQTSTQSKANYIKIGTLVRTSCIVTPDTKLFSRVFLTHRREDNGTFYGYVPGSVGNLLYIKHYDSSVAVYSIDEVKTVGDNGSVVITKNEIVDFANEIKTRLYERFQGKKFYISDITQALRDMLVHKLTKEGWGKFQANKVSDSSLRKSV